MNRHNLITDLFNEEYEREVVQQVETELAAYKKVAEKLEAAVGVGEVDLKCLENDWLFVLPFSILLLHLS